MNDYRDLIWSLIPLVLICVVLAAVASQCSFAAHGPTPGQVPNFDVQSALHDDAETLSFPIRDPEVPADWKPNSGSRDTVTGPSGGAVSTVGYITSKGTYLQLSQSNAGESALADHIVSTRSPSGSRMVGGQKWTVYHVAGSEPGWIADFGTSRVLIKGAADEASYLALAQAVGAATPLRP
ncbi:DUF4245 domain-containing protein [Nocardia veterana]|uniref:DUF4245 domain-containing protein n=2 Tax=Nocardia veterana TaxID=132249 RepID=A0A7X6M004_9NOCA|nr:DUF4245 domain-containing protein [Nocardia veterana]